MAAVSEVCLELTLSSGSSSCCCGGKRIMSSRDSSPSDASSSMFENIIHGDGDGGTGRSWLKLYEDLWEIKKVLTKSDVDGSSRLLLSTQVVEEHIMKHMDGSQRERVNSVGGARIRVRDYDTAGRDDDGDDDQYYELTLKRWRSTGSYVLVNNWKRDFEKRRGLKCNDEVGLLWDPFHSLLWFRVLRRGPPPSSS